MESNTTIIVLTKNEVESIEFTITELEKKNLKNILIVDANSNDGTLEFIKKKKIKFITQKNKGYGAAIIEGMQHVYTEYVSVIDADGSYNGNDIPNMLRILKEENLDFVLGSRYLNGNISKDDTFIRALGNKIFTWIVRFFFNVSITDALFHFPVCKTQAYKNLNLKFEDFSICPELPILIKKKNYKFREFLSIERPRIGGESKVNAFIDGTKILYSLFLLFLNINIFRKK